ncbi:MAG: cytochrome b/b6 domain-containing protein [Betaproteobacteria bacterium]
MREMQARSPVRVWDLPVRLFHWLLVLLVITLFVTGKLGGNWLEWHKRAGFSVLGLVAFRIIWGFAGSFHARFVNFLCGPKVILTYVKSLTDRNAPHYAGHNPLGAISVVAMLLALMGQAILGLFSNDDLMLEGPYAVMVSKALSDQLTGYHKLNGSFILVLIGLHLAAIAFAYFYKEENLIVPMLTGDKKMLAPEAPPAERRPAWLAWVIGTCVALATYLLLNK